MINGAFQRECAVDELSLVVAPIVASANDLPLFDGSALDEYRLVTVKNTGNSVLWLNFKKLK